MDGCDFLSGEAQTTNSMPKLTKYKKKKEEEINGTQISIRVIFVGCLSLDFFINRMPKSKKKNKIKNTRIQFFLSILIVCLDK